MATKKTKALMTVAELIEVSTLEQLIEFRDELQMHIAFEFEGRKAQALAEILKDMHDYGITAAIIEDSMRKRRGPRKNANGAAS